MGCQRLTLFFFLDICQLSAVSPIFKSAAKSDVVWQSFLYIRNVASLLELLVVYRFAEVAELIRVCRLEIIAKINTCLLSPATLYTVYLVFKFASTIYGLENQPVDVYGLDNQPVDATMKLDGGEYGARTVSWNAQGMHRCNSSVTVRGRVHYPEERGDGWLEMELGDFFSTEKEDGELEIRFFLTTLIIGNAG
ncbi:F-box protein PP2-B13 [Populus alba]|uniref:F-box protein PP2-B13 n=1 Tax=Populus alba TaxID=43335 RepID=UPI003CC71962